jgi:hypothetical protein
MPEFIEKVSPGVDVMKPKIWQRPHASIEARSRQGRDENLTNPMRENPTAILTKWGS